MKTQKRLDVDKLQNPATAEEFQIRIGGAFEPLIGLETNNFEELYSQFKNITNRVIEQVVGYKRKKQVQGLPPEIEEACAQRRKARQDMLNSPGDEAKRAEYMKHNTQKKATSKRPRTIAQYHYSPSLANFCRMKKSRRDYRRESVRL